MAKLDVTASVTPTTSQTKLSAEAKEAAKKKLNEFIKEETRLVKGIFQNFECPGGNQAVFVKKYPGLEPFNKTMEDGKEYEVPLYVARFLNGIDVTAEHIGGKVGTCSYPQHSHIMDSDGNPTISVEKRKKRFGFQSLEFGGM